MLKIVVTTHRFIRTEAANECSDRGCHAVARIRIDIVGSESRLVELGGRVTFPDRPLARAEHADGGYDFHGLFALVHFQVVLQRRLELFFHDVKSLIPADRSEFTFLVVFAVGHTQQGLRQAIFAVHDLGQKITLDTVETAIHRCVRIPLGSDDSAVFSADQHAATGATESAGRLVPTNIILASRHCSIDSGNRDTGGCCGSGDRVGFDELSSAQFHFSPPLDHIRVLAWSGF